MREIKFRAWDKEKKKMFIPFDLYESHWELYEKPFEEDWRKENLEIMQFTGLKDKNGKEIYEGDIVRANCKAVIVWEDDGFQVKLTDRSKDIIERVYEEAAYQRIIDFGEIEVIGNIYENPELLTPPHKEA